MLATCAAASGPAARPDWRASPGQCMDAAAGMPWWGYVIIGLVVSLLLRRVAIVCRRGSGIAAGTASTARAPPGPARRAVPAVSRGQTPVPLRAGAAAAAPVGYAPPGYAPVGGGQQGYVAAAGPGYVTAGPRGGGYAPLAGTGAQPPQPQPY